MYLKSLTLRGFKSFASATTLVLEPGITCVVGPNGSGKSNVVDALSWVMGEQGAKSLRGGRMEDVIFAGTAGRPPLGRAEVVLTIDNSDQALPIDYSEVTISRTMFRSGGSEYAINGSSCRLLDIQELLSDSGIGRAMHVVVGQGQLDSVLHATAEERRGFVEEAAGVLKHRKRKEKALRKLDATEANLTRLADLTRELRRQLSPLAKQAEAARTAAVVQAELRDARLRLLADDAVRVQAELERDLADEAKLHARRDEVERAVAQARSQLVSVEREHAEQAPVLAQHQQAWARLTGLAAGVRGTGALAEERRRHLSVPLPAVGADPEATEAEAGQVRAEQQSLVREADMARAALETAVDGRAVAERAADAAQRRLQSLRRAQADRQAEQARLGGQVAGLQRRVAVAEDEISELDAAEALATSRAAQARAEFAALESSVAGLSAGEEGLDAEHEAAEAERAALQAREEELREREQQLTSERRALQARAEALRAGLERRDASAALLADVAQGGIVGALSSLVHVEPGAERAAAVALGPAGDAVAAAGHAAAVGAIRRLRAEELGRAVVLVNDDGGVPGAAAGPTAPLSPGAGWPSLPAGHRYLVQVLHAPVALHHAIAALLDRVVLVEDLAAATALVAELGGLGLVAATRDGDLVGSHLVIGGAGDGPSRLEVERLVEDADHQAARLGSELEQLRFAAAGLAGELEQAREREAAALESLHESDASLAAVAETLSRHAGDARSATAEVERLARARTQLAQRLEQARSELGELEDRLRLSADGTQPRAEPDPGDHDEAVATAAAARAVELEARLRLRTVEERLRATSNRADALDRSAAEQRQGIQRHRRLSRERAEAAQVVASVGTAAAVLAERVEATLGRAASELEAAEAARAAREQGMRAARARLETLGHELDDVVSSVHRDEMLRTELRMRLTALHERAGEEWGVAGAALVEEYGPHLLLPGTQDPYVRQEQEQRASAAERQLARLGRVNPLALEEYAAAEERLAFLTEQLEDLQRTKRDLLTIVRDVDDRVQEVFAEAFEDTAREFQAVFARLFPGGEGRLVLTEPDDLLATGVEVEARPPGKRVKRLSLLSGGERSLVAVAFLVALFKARPSPFYVLDEVEAALDDTNLGRLLEIYEELRESSQLIVVTHQKRTMEIADALYGASMRGDGVTAVISQRIREAQPA